MEGSDKVPRSSTIDEETSHCYKYNPLYFLARLLKSFFKCFDLDSASHCYPQSENEITTTEEFEGKCTTRSRRPPRPPISSGQGGQTNSASS